MNLPGIRKIYTVDATTLSPQLESKAIAGLPITIPTGLNEIKFFGEATCSVEEKSENNGMVEEVELVFATTEKIGTSKHLAFVIQDVNGNHYLIGTKEAPYPTVKKKHGTSTTYGEHSIWEYTVEHAGSRAKLSCVMT